jgi:predicted nucleotidyltransferase
LLPVDVIAREFGQAVRRELGDDVKELVLFGSRARGDAHEGSDYDVLLVVPARTRELRDRLLDIEVDFMNRYGALFATLLRSVDEWRATAGFPLAINIEREGVPL